MSSNAIRQFSSTAKRSILILSGKVTLADVQSVNGAQGVSWVESVKKMRDAVEILYPDVTQYMIQGAKAHKSSKDPTDSKDTINVGFYSKNGTRFLSGHAHEDGSYKLTESRAGRGKAKGQQEGN
ncbi:hypothetical protein LOZ12_001372 [Ophidiomyces ophidiicola]|uniref:Uncharacterized protein n=1 Tax=Ophidiomyces ophidiicola TaxID=1387563 RepID=A0ACB8UWV4_9EURO|nr:hypothetical protein LOZ61_004909 [Ophidiomyces ophidiicola]KAI1913072.1 hypothetical protein LOZ64_004225 [Ophidiomyces ophidiicola]KAI1924876.1 hypothetical protein LOZ60_004476 [Ophidiomyces ophidiicola]KAI1943118.1 hypothetical protein LOZ62_004434 [Ophidiomyces ophidiicola]KAI1966167.1 hypothetical protein LOZ59_000984 [Ophidiomyces ophidiicola]